MVHQTEKSKDVSHIRLKLVPFPGRNGDEISFMDFHHLISQKGMALSFEIITACMCLWCSKEEKPPFSTWK